MESAIAYRGSLHSVTQIAFYDNLFKSNNSFGINRHINNADMDTVFINN